MNTGTDAQRIATGRAREARLMERARFAGIDILPSSGTEDMHQKIDAWISEAGARRSVQIKTRDGLRTDLGLAIFRPYDPATRTGQPDRDWRFTPDLYLTTVRDQLFMCDGRRVHLMVKALLRGPASYRTRNGSELRSTTDKGSGYAAGQLKLMAYITPADLVLHARGEFL